jgi:glutamate-5-semialdehyde dehydrogenase
MSERETTVSAEVQRIAKSAQRAARIVAKSPAPTRERALHGAAALLRSRVAEICAENAADVEAAKAKGLAGALVDRLVLDGKRIEAMAKALVEVAAIPDPLGSMEKTWRRPNGLTVGKMRIPLGVILMIYEARPNVTTDAFALCLRAGNAVILRGGSEAARTNRVLGGIIAEALVEAGLPAEAAQVVPSTDREMLAALLERDEEIDLCIPRGGEGLIRFVAENARVPVVKHYKGVCHVFVDASADAEMALAICENAKVSRPGVCNACETILVHRTIAPSFLPRLVERLSRVEIRGCAETQALGGKRVIPATEADWSTEYLDLVVSVRVVGSLDEAVAHIEQYGSQHTEAIVTSDYAMSRRFVDEVQSSTVVVNASTRFADGGELGLGAEIGISTSKLHAYGPMGAGELTTTKFVVLGRGQVRT